MDEKQLIAIIAKYLLNKGVPSKYIYSNLAHIVDEVFATVSIELGRKGGLNEKNADNI